MGQTDEHNTSRDGQRGGACVNPTAHGGLLSPMHIEADLALDFPRSDSSSLAAFSSPLAIVLFALLSALRRIFSALACAFVRTRFAFASNACSRASITAARLRSTCSGVICRLLPTSNPTLP